MSIHPATHPTQSTDMGRLKQFQIQLDNPSGVYFGGDVVQGTIFLGLEGNGKKARGEDNNDPGIY